jgi:catechol 2,3-dioxygenase-like lactoylglutathione lyase family enzyme
MELKVMTAKLVPELLVSNHAISRDFYVRILGFQVRYERPAEKFCYLDLGGAELMIEQETDFWTTAPREQPYGRGINLQVEVDKLDPILARLKHAAIALFRPVEEAWYRTGDTYGGNRQFLVQDPDGYLLRIFEDLGQQRTPPGGRIVG